MNWDFGLNLIFMLLSLTLLSIAIAFFMFMCLIVQERTLMLDCLNNGGRWFIDYSIGCTFPMG